MGNDIAYYNKLRRLEELRKTCSLMFYEAYEKQLDFHAAGAKFRERLLMAANRVGKTYCAGFETTMHLTGVYPDWWPGLRFKKCVQWWGGSVTAELTREGMQTVLLGPVGHWGEGCIPKELILDIKRARGIPDAVESVQVRSLDGSVSNFTFKAYKDGREAWQAATVHGVWFDEEPPYDIYSEGLTRTNTTKGPVYLTFTPLLGLSDVVLRFTNEVHPDRHVTNMTIDDAKHIDEETKRVIIASYKPHELEARTKGIPMLGSGRIFPVAEAVIAEEPLEVVPKHWKQIIGIDFGWDHPTAAVHLLYDEESDVIHVRKVYRKAEDIPLMHAAAIKPWGNWVPVAWPHDGLQHDKGSGIELQHQYREHGLHMLSEKATFGDDRGNGVEAGLMEMLERMQTGRLKVDVNLAEWWEEFRMYHRKEGQVVKLRDDLMSATRYAIMMLRYAIPQSQAAKFRDRYSLRRSISDTTWMSS